MEHDRAILDAIMVRPLTIFWIMEITGLSKAEALQHMHAMPDVYMRRGMWRMRKDMLPTKAKKKPVAPRRIDIPWQLDAEAREAISSHQAMAIEDIGDMLGVSKGTIIEALRSGLTKVGRMLAEDMR